MTEKGLNSGWEWEADLLPPSQTTPDIDVDSANWQGLMNRSESGHASWLAAETGRYTIRFGCSRSDPERYTVTFQVTSGSTDTGQVATDFPGTLVASGAVVTSVLDCVTATSQLFAIDLTAGDSLLVAEKGLNPGWEWQADLLPPSQMTPDIDVNSANWQGLMNRSESGHASWLAAETGRYTIRFGCSRSDPERYTVTFQVTR